MRRKAAACLLVLAFGCGAPGSGFVPPPVLAAGLIPAVQQKDDATMPIDHKPWKQILERHVVPGKDGINRFAYGRVSAADRRLLKDYIATLARTEVSRLKPAEQWALWSNLYNALTIDVVLDHYPVASIRDISLGGGLFAIGPWKRELVTVEGRALSLDNIEHDILRKQWKDPRVHYAVNCASASCPNLQAEPFTAANLDSLLDRAARDYINHPRGASFRNGRLWLSQIYSWYRRDFGSTDAEVIAHIARYAEPALAAQLAQTRSIAGYDYDWSLNDSR